MLGTKMASSLPASLKGIQLYMSISKQLEKHQPLLSYYVLMYAVQLGIQASKQDPTAKGYLLNLMGVLEEKKKVLCRDPDMKEKLDNEIVAQSYVEDHALSIFEAADKKDRAAQFDKSMAKQFFLSGYLFEALQQFGELDSEIKEKMKYAKWKAVEINKCLKSGIMPTPGPPGDWDPQEPSDPLPPPSSGERPVPMPRHNPPPQPSADAYPPGPAPSTSAYPPGPTPSAYPPGPTPSAYPPGPTPSAYPPGPAPSAYPPGPTPSAYPPGPTYNPPLPQTHPLPPPSHSGPAPNLGTTEVARAQKLCKFASSALDYDDPLGAIEYLSKALKLLQTGKED